jgi:hypothetical protein
MLAEYSESHESSNTYDSERGNENSILERPQSPGECKIALFDWDNTLFCTQYLDMLQLDYKNIFSEKKSLEEVGTYLIYEIQNLEEVSKFLYINI